MSGKYDLVFVHICNLLYILDLMLIFHVLEVKNIENGIYREELKESLGMIFFSPFKPEREFKVYKSCKCLQIICSRVHYYSMFPRLFISI